MQQLATMEISETVDGVERRRFAAEDDPTVRIEYEDNANSDEQTYTCRHCGLYITREGDHAPWKDIDFGDDICTEADHGHDVAADELRHPSRWLNSARITVNGSEVEAMISVGDPRGGFAFTVWMHRDGYLMMRVPHPSHGAPHMKLTELNPGTYRIG
ncbi:MAG: hypothetical protein WA317_01490 [Mycobacterium sp.]|uniref:hypothetical protein n=1 Tax=Mycobacterium sp. TaxID=1785 RepID=UPI003CC538E0